MPHKQKVFNGLLVKTCECGCGEIVKMGNKFILGHNSKGKNNVFYGKHLRPWNKGLTKETDKRIVAMSETKIKGKFLSCDNCRKSIWVFPSLLKEYKYHFCNVKCHDEFQKGRFIGENSSTWQGGKTPKNKKIRNSIEFRFWRNTIYKRDYWTCQMCEKRGGIKLHAHHIWNFALFSYLRFNIDNGITLCGKCHSEIHGRILNAA